VQAIAVWDDTVYAGGHFYLMGGVVRTRLLDLDAATGTIKSWTLHVPCCSPGNLGVWTLEVDASRGRLYAGGNFTEIEKQPHTRFAHFSIR
jgi:hypothetical protein